MVIPEKRVIISPKSGIKEIEILVKDFFDDSGFPLSRNPNDLIFFAKYFIFCKEVIKDSQKYVPEFLDDIIEKNLNCINFIKTPSECLPLFNGATSIKLSQIEKYLENHKSHNKNNILVGCDTNLIIQAFQNRKSLNQDFSKTFYGKSNTANLIIEKIINAEIK